MPRETIVLTARDVAAHLGTPDCIDAIREALRLHEAGHSSGPTSLGLRAPQGTFHVKAAGLAVRGRSYIVAKANINLPGNPERAGLPTIQGVLVLIDADTGAPLAVMDSIVVTSVRTGAAAAVAADLLALPEADTITIVGCGEQGAIQLRSMAAVRPLRRAWVHDVTPGKAARLAERMSRDLGIDVVETADLADAIARSQIAVTCTTSSAPVLDSSHLHAGLFIAAVGADNPGKQELAPGVLAGARVVVDSLEACAAGGDLHHAIEAGVMRREDVHGELSAVVSGRVAGRSTADEIFVFDSTGTALQDVAAAVLVYGRAAAVADRRVTFGE